MMYDLFLFDSSRQWARFQLAFEGTRFTPRVLERALEDPEVCVKAVWGLHPLTKPEERHKIASPNDLFKYYDPELLPDNSFWVEDDTFDLLLVHVGRKKLSSSVFNCVLTVKSTEEITRECLSRGRSAFLTECLPAYTLFPELLEAAPAVPSEQGGAISLAIAKHIGTKWRQLQELLLPLSLEVAANVSSADTRVVMTSEGDPRGIILVRPQKILLSVDYQKEALLIVHSWAKTDKAMEAIPFLILRGGDWRVGVVVRVSESDEAHWSFVETLQVHQSGVTRNKATSILRHFRKLTRAKLKRSNIESRIEVLGRSRVWLQPWLQEILLIDYKQDGSHDPDDDECTCLRPVKVATLRYLRGFTSAAADLPLCFSVEVGGRSGILRFWKKFPCLAILRQAVELNLCPCVVGVARVGQVCAVVERSVVEDFVPLADVQDQEYKKYAQSQLQAVLRDMRLRGLMPDHHPLSESVVVRIRSRKKLDIQFRSGMYLIAAREPRVLI